jgi:hypothetical protein
MGILSRINENPQYRLLRHKTIGRTLSQFRKTNVAMFHIGRSGSTVLTDMLNQHREVSWQCEIYDKPIRQAHEGNYPVAPQAREILQLYQWKAGHLLSGIEVKPFHLRELGVSLPDYVEMLRQFKYTHYIVLERHNYLRTIVSVLSAYKTSVWHYTGKAELQKIEIPVNGFDLEYYAAPLLKHLEIYEDEFKQLYSLFTDLPLLRLTYEDDIACDPYIGYRRLCRFLGLTPYEVSVRFTKVNPFPLKDMIMNYDEVADTLHGTRFAWMLEETVSQREHDPEDSPEGETRPPQ